MNITIYCGSNIGKDEKYAQAARELGEWMAENGHALVYGGGNIGLMGIIADAVLAGGGHVTGVIPEFLVHHEKGHEGAHVLEIVPDMKTRKNRMIELGDLYVAMPGGPGTLEEISETISHHRLGLIQGRSAFLNIDGFYDDVKSAYETMAREGFMPKEDYDNIIFANSVAELAKVIKDTSVE